MTTITIKATDKATPVLAELSRRLTNRSGLHAFVAAKEEVMFREYLRGQAGFRHKTADGLGATRSGAMERAAQSPEGTSTSQGAEISLKPGHVFARTFRDVVIVPTGGRKYLTIPVAAAAYNRRAGQFGGSLRFLRVGPNKQAILAKDTGGNGALQTMYLLVPRVRQKQDRTLLPTDDLMISTAEEAAKDYVLQAEGGQTV